ncbi:MAG: hypothetical protein U0232_26890 [Thermomicrobiales bacterium]
MAIGMYCGGVRPGAALLLGAALAAATGALLDTGSDERPGTLVASAPVPPAADAAAGAADAAAAGA